MESPLRRSCLFLGLVTVLATLMTLVPRASFTLVHAGSRAVSPTPAFGRVVADGPSLHNPTFDNGLWYEFHLRYAYGTMVGCWVPDDDIPNGPQDWRLWLQHGTDLINVDPTDSSAGDPEHTEPKAVKLRPYRGQPYNHQVAGLYQVIYDTTPCLIYEFGMYGQSSPRGGYPPPILKVGIDQVGWHPDSTKNIGVIPTDYPPDGFPATTVWGTAHKYQSVFGLLTVSAEAWNDRITVYTYADAIGDSFHRIVWDTGSFREVTLEVRPELISDPDHPPVAGGIHNLTVTAGSTSATANWSTSEKASGQVYYRRIYVPSTPVIPPGTLLPYVVYLPVVAASYTPGPWTSTMLNTSPSTTHSEVISGLQPDSTYEYIVASRGLSGGQCVTWVSDKKTFTTAPSQ